MTSCLNNRIFTAIIKPKIFVASSTICDSDPCSDIQNAVPGSCQWKNVGEFACLCSPAFLWDKGMKTCIFGTFNILVSCCI